MKGNHTIPFEKKMNNRGQRTLQLTWRQFFGPFSVMVMILLNVPFNASGQTSSMLRVGFSRVVIGAVNENDAMAAVKIWASLIAKERGIPADTSPKIFKNTTEIATALTDKTVDCISISLNEYVELGALVAGDKIVASVRSGSTMEKSVLLVHRDSGIERLGDLRGRRIGLLLHPRASLGPAWLDTILARENLGPATDFFEQIVTATKTGKSVLPVFFRHLDACLVLQSGFETMVELNPQIGHQLKVLSISPPVIPILFCFRADYNAPVRKQVMDELSHWHLNPAGRQILTIFQADSLEELPVNSLDSTLELLAEHRRLCDKTVEGADTDATAKP